MNQGSRKIVLASRNRDKLRELSALCQGLPFTVVSALDYPDLPEIIEDGTSTLGNASRKAIVTAAFTGEIAVADDTALQGRALNELPDTFSSRFAGPDVSYADNVRLLLDLLANVPDDQRQARFECTTVWVDPRPRASVGSRFEVAAPATGRWLHNPFARAIEVKDPRQEDEFWNQLLDRRQVWADYDTRLRTILADSGADHDRLVAIIDRLTAPFLGGGRPTDAQPGAMRLPDPRIWTADGPTAGDPPPTRVAPSGLPPDAPGRTACEALWLEIATEGRLLGAINREPLGDNGFGYDPVFVPDGLDLTLAELPDGQKNALSHRGRALTRLLDAARRAYATPVKSSLP
jgi:inosine/xanthosine triphosphate pyrophosphatase family protein